MKKFIYKLLVVCATLLIGTTACDDDKEFYRIPKMEDNIGAVTKLTRPTDPAKTFFDARFDLAGQAVEFTLDIDDFGVTEVTSVDVELLFVEKNGTFDPRNGALLDSVYAQKFVKKITTFPSLVTVSADECAAALGKSVSDFEVGDAFTVVFPINTADGRRLTTALASELCGQQYQPSFGGCSFAWGVACPSNIKTGAYTVALVSSNIGPENFRSPFDITITKVGSDQYRLSDGTMDIFREGDAPFPIGLDFRDVCENVAIVRPSPDFPTLVLFDNKGGSSYDPVTGVLTFDIVYNAGSCCGLAGIEYKFTATPK